MAKGIQRKVYKVDGNMIKEPKVGMYVLKQHKASGRYILGRIIGIGIDDYSLSYFDSELLVLYLIKCNDYGYIQLSDGKYEGCPAIYNYKCNITNEYEILFANSYAEILAKVV